MLTEFSPSLNGRSSALRKTPATGQFRPADGNARANRVRIASILLSRFVLRGVS